MGEIIRGKFKTPHASVDTSKGYLIQEFFVTVGVQYGNHATQEKHPLSVTHNGYTVIEAPDYETARRITFAIFGDKFAFLYDVKPSVHYHPKGEELRIGWTFGGKKA